MTVVIYLLLLSMVIYTGILLWFLAGNLFSDKNPISLETPPVSVIIAIRNGVDSLPRLLADLAAQDYSGEMEFILVDDESDDATRELIQEKSVDDKRFIYESSLNGDYSLQHKKRALDAGIKKAQNEWLLFTDVDCKVPSGWIQGMVAYFTADSDYVIGHSEVDSGKSLVTIFQALDYLMLLIAARGSAKSGHPWAATGQNQAYRKSLFTKVGGFAKISNQKQGDDSLFLHLCRKYAKARVVFADNINCHIQARQEKTWRSLFRQRLRWSGDANIMWRFNPVFFLSILVTFLVHCILMVFSVQMVLGKTIYFPILVKSLLIKFIFEFILYFTGTMQLEKKLRFRNFIYWFFIHVPYITLMGIGSFFAEKMSWRGRSVKI